MGKWMGWIEILQRALDEGNAGRFVCEASPIFEGRVGVSGARERFLDERRDRLEQKDVVEEMEQDVRSDTPDASTDVQRPSPQLSSFPSRRLERRIDRRQLWKKRQEKEPRSKCIYAWKRLEEK